MAKVTFSRIGSLVNGTAAINGVITEIETAFDNLLSRDGDSPNQLTANLDMNNNRILNLPAPVSSNEPVRKADIQLDVLEEYVDEAAASAGAAATSASNALASANSALASKNAAEIAVVNASNASRLTVSTTTLPAGTPPTASISGLPGSQVLSLGLSTGLTGPAGQNGVVAQGQLYATTSAALSFGVVGLTSLVGGSGGTNGTFALAFSGGGGTGAAGVFTVSGGAVTGWRITSPGVNYSGAPTVSFAASAGLTGASATVQTGQNQPPGTYFCVVSSNPSVSYEVWQHVQGVGAQFVNSVASNVPPAPVTITESRTLTAGDSNRLLQVAIPGPISNSLSTLRIPTHAADPIPIGSSYEIVRYGGTPVRFVPSDGVFVYAPPQADLVEAHSWAKLHKAGTNTWTLYGERLGAAPSNALNARVWLDPSDLTSLRVERTGASATTQSVVNGPVGSARNKGTLGGWFIADADDRRPTLRTNGTRFWLEFDGNTAANQGDYLRLPAPAINLATMEMHVGMRIPGWVSGQSGVVTFAPSPIGTGGTSDITSLQGMGFYINGSDNSVAARGGPASSLLMSVAGIKPDFHVYEFRKPNNTSANITVNGIVAASDTTVTENFTTTGGDLFIGVRFANGAVNSPGNFELSELIITEQVVGDPASLRTFMEAQTFGTVPQYPAISNTTQLDAARTTLISQVFATRGGVIPSDVATLETVANPVPSLTNVASVQRLVIPGYPARPRLFTPTGTIRNEILFVCTGHDVGLSGNGISGVAIQSALNRGLRVVGFVLPNGPDELTAGDPNEHETARSPLSEWVGPVSIAINTLLASFPSSTFHICGISGGGFMATLSGACDSRIRRTYDFVGSAPDYYYLNRDWEQRLPGITATFMDLYLLAACPSPRRHKHIWHEFDPVAFNMALYNSRPPWDAQLATQAALIGGGDYDFVWDMGWNQHALRNPFWTTQVLDEISP